MTLKICFRCDWQGETMEPECPNCGAHPLYVVDASPSGEAGMVVSDDPEEQNPEATSTTSGAPSRTESHQSNQFPAATDVVESSSPSGRSAVAFVLAALVLTFTLGTWLSAHEERSAPAASTDAEVHEAPAGDGSPGPVVSHGPGALVRINARTGEIVGTVPIPFPKLLASDGRSVWVFTEGGATRTALVRVDATKAGPPGDYYVADARAAADYGEGTVSSLAAAGGSAWLGNDGGGLFRLAPGASAIERANRDVPALGNLAPDSLVGAAGSLWMSWFPAGPCCDFPPDLYRVDPATGRVIARIYGATQVVASGTRFVWAVVDTQADTLNLVRIDTGKRGATLIGAPEFPWADLTVADGVVWASSPEDDTIVRLDPVTGGEIERVRAGGEPGALAAGAGVLWAAIGENGTVERHDLETGQVETIDVGGTPNDLVFAHGSVWVTVFGSTEAPVGADTSPLSFEVPIGRQTLTVDGVPFTFRVRTAGWEAYGGLLMGKSETGPQGAEAVIFWAGFPDGRSAAPWW
jgi:hypothetical protein